LQTFSGTKTSSGTRWKRAGGGHERHPNRATGTPPPPPPAAPAEPAPERPQLDPAAPQIAALVSAVSGAAVIQVGAFASEVEALQAWDNFQIQHDSLVTGLSQDIQLADLGERGIWYRVRIGPFATRDSASSLCEQLQSEGANCFVAAP